MHSLVYIGAIHGDLQGPSRLRKALHHFSPDHVAVEFDDVRAWMLEKAIVKLQKQKREDKLAALRSFVDAPNLDMFLLYMHQEGYEYRVAQEFCYATGTPLHLVDGDFQGLRTAIEQGNIADLIPETVRTRDAYIEHMEGYYNWPAELFKMAIESFPEREQGAKDNLLRLEGNVVYICGLAHMYPANNSVAQLLPGKAFKLNSADLLPDSAVPSLRTLR